jgi:hypothetical protein
MELAINEGPRLNPWDVWMHGIDPITDALERLSVLLRSDAGWDEEYAFSLGAATRQYANQCPAELRAGIEMILVEHGDNAAINGWQSEAPKNHATEVSKNEGA